MKKQFFLLAAAVAGVILAGCTLPQDPKPASSATATGSTTPAAPAKPATAAPTPVVVPPPPAAVTPPAVVVAPPSVPTLPAYRPQAAASGRLRSVGSDTMDKIVEKWEAAFQAFHPQLRVAHEGRGSSTAIPALIEGRADIGPMSRPVADAELRRFQDTLGYAPTQLRVGIDALAIYVHPENPIAQRGLTIAEIDAIFSATRNRKHPGDVVRWGDLGLTGIWAAQPINLYSRNRASGTFGWFKDTVLQKGEFKAEVRELPGSADVVAAVAADRFGIGYSGFGYATPNVRFVPVSKEAGQPFVQPSEATALNNSYPLSRALFVTVNRNPAAPTPPALAEFGAFILSREGQAIVREEGYFMLSPSVAAEELAKLLK